MPKLDGIKKVMIISSGPIVIGQACEFDYSGTQACKALRQLGYEIVLANSNPATIMTDPGMADATYIEPLNLEAMKEIVEKSEVGFVVNPDDKKELISALKKLSTDSELYNKFKQNCKKASEELNWEKEVVNLLNTINS